MKGSLFSKVLPFMMMALFCFSQEMRGSMRRIPSFSMSEYDADFDDSAAMRRRQRRQRQQLKRMLVARQRGGSDLSDDVPDIPRARPKLKRMLAARQRGGSDLSDSFDAPDILRARPRRRKMVRRERAGGEASGDGGSAEGGAGQLAGAKKRRFRPFGFRFQKERIADVSEKLADDPFIKKMPFSKLDRETDVQHEARKKKFIDDVATAIVSDDTPFILWRPLVRVFQAGLTDEQAIELGKLDIAQKEKIKQIKNVTQKNALGQIKWDTPLTGEHQMVIQDFIANNSFASKYSTIDQRRAWLKALDFLKGTVPATIAIAMVIHIAQKLQAGFEDKVASEIQHGAMSALEGPAPRRGGGGSSSGIPPQLAGYPPEIAKAIMRGEITSQEELDAAMSLMQQ